MAWARHGRCESDTAVLWGMGKTHSKPLAARHGRGTAWARHAMCESATVTGSYIIIMCININNFVINNNNGRLQDLLLLFQIALDTRKDFLKIYRQFGHEP